MYRSKTQSHLYKASIAVAYKLPVGKTFRYKDLKKQIVHHCDTKEQGVVGRRFAYLVKHANVPFIIIDPVSPIIYQRIQGGK